MTSRMSLRQRRNRVQGVGPSPSDVAARRTAPQPGDDGSDGGEGAGRGRNRRGHVGIIENALSYLLLP